MSPHTLPMTVEGLTAEWLEAAIGEQHGGISVTSA
jgi:hypothetical protein